MIAKAKTGRSGRKHGFYCDNRKDQYSRGMGGGRSGSRPLQTGVQITSLCLGISYCGKPIRVRPK